MTDFTYTTISTGFTVDGSLMPARRMRAHPIICWLAKWISIDPWVEVPDRSLINALQREVAACNARMMENLAESLFGIDLAKAQEPSSLTTDELYEAFGIIQKVRKSREEIFNLLPSKIFFPNFTDEEKATAGHLMFKFHPHLQVMMSDPRGISHLDVDPGYTPISERLLRRHVKARVQERLFNRFPNARYVP